uniref:Bee-milk protein n=1 Tax=Clastoptera arizonana TaxID=38151 RepID=A0A1B6DJW0_9HEMI
MHLQFILVILLLFGHTQGKGKLYEVFSWKQLDFQFPNNTIRNSLLHSKKYIPENNNMLGLEVWKDKLFITVPRWYTGVASTLNYVSLHNTNKSPQLSPYPDYESNDIHNGNFDNRIISATRIFVDSCDRLWVVDSGRENIFISPKYITTNKIFVFNLNSNKLIRKITIGQNLISESGMIFELVVDVANTDCSKSFAYLADTTGYGLLVYSWEENILTKVSNSYMYFEPQSSVFNNIQFNDGIMGLALSPVRPDGFRSLYFHSLASYNEYNVSTEVLRNPILSGDFTRFRLMGSRGEKGQSTTQRLDEKTGVLFYTQVMKNGIGCWNSKMYPDEYSTATNGLVVVDRTRITFPSALTLDRNRNIWVVSNNLLSFAASTLNRNEYNYRILYAPVDILIEGTICKGQSEANDIPSWKT